MPALQDAPVTFVVLFVYLVATAWTGLYPTTESLVGHGAAVGFLVPDEPWRLVSAAFLHGGVLHVGVNSFSLIWVGPMVERSLGGSRYVLLYLVTAIGGNITGLLSQSPLAPLIGGSGAIFGMLGALLALFMRMGRTHLEFLAFHGPRSLVGMIVANLVLGFMIPQVSNAAHVGGLISGFVLTYMFFDRGRGAADAVTRLLQAGWIAIFAAGVLYSTRPTLSWSWSVRQALHGSTLEIREDHARRLRLEGFTLGDLEREFRTELPEVWGDSGRRLVQRLFD